MLRRFVVGLILGLSVVLGLVSSSRPPMPPGFLSAFPWRGDDPMFGGFSAIEVSSDGLSFTAINDQAAWVSATITRDGNGRITQVTTGPIRKLIDQYGKTFEGFRSDSEGLAIGADGTAFVSFEQFARVMRISSFDTKSTLLPMPDSFKPMFRNAALEALAIDADGILYTLAERPPGPFGTFPVYRFRNGAWDQPFDLPRRGSFLAVSADIGPDGQFYLLERRFHALAGFSSRVRRFKIGPSGIEREETLLQSSIGQHDNLEGLAVWRDRDGMLRLTMIADNNFLFLQRTELVEYRIPD